MYTKTDPFLNNLKLFAPALFKVSGLESLEVTEVAHGGSDLTVFDCFVFSFWLFYFFKRHSQTRKTATYKGKMSNLTRWGFRFDIIFHQAETVGFEPTCRLPDNRISSAARYDHFDTSPKIVLRYYKVLFWWMQWLKMFCNGMTTSAYLPHRQKGWRIASSYGDFHFSTAYLINA